jgi:hypothetical protein
MARASFCSGHQHCGRTMPQAHRRIRFIAMLPPWAAGAVAILVRLR